MHGSLPLGVVALVVILAPARRGPLAVGGVVDGPVARAVVAVLVAGGGEGDECEDGQEKCERLWGRDVTR